MVGVIEFKNQRRVNVEFSQKKANSGTEFRWPKKALLDKIFLVCIFLKKEKLKTVREFFGK